MSSPPRARDALDNAAHGAAAALSVDALPKCDECDEGPATHQCSDPKCIDFGATKLCDQCCEQHRTRKPTKLHKLVSLDRCPLASTSSNTPATTRPAARGDAATRNRNPGNQAADGGQASASTPSQRGKEIARQDHPATSTEVRNQPKYSAGDYVGQGSGDTDGRTSGARLRMHLAQASGSASARPAATLRSRAGVVSDGQKLPPRVTPEQLKIKRSWLPLWKMANQHVRREYHFPEPGKELNQLHRPMICNMTYWKGDELKTCIMARIIMVLATVKPKQEAIFGSSQIPPDYGGGPWFAAARACFEPSRLAVGNVLQHDEVIIKGLTQLTKTPELVFQAFVCFFAQGVLPIIMVRNRGGAVVGRDDMFDAVCEMNRCISVIFDDVSHLYSNHVEFERIKKTDFHLSPRCTSGKPPQFLEIHGDGHYALKYHQVLISCTNVHSIKIMTETSQGRSLGSQMRMSLLEWASGYRNTGDAEDANPHAPYIYDLEDIPAHLLKHGDADGEVGTDGDADGDIGTKEAFPKAAIALLFDEDDANRSSTGSEKTDKLLFQVCPKLESTVNDMREWAKASSEEYGSEAEDDDRDGREAAEPEAAEEAQFYNDLGKMQLRARVAGVFAYTATPMTLIHEAQQSVSQVNHNMLELRPGRNYIGYPTERSQKKWPWLEKHIEIQELPNRIRRESFTLTYMYPRIMRQCVDPNFQDDDVMPEPFRTSEKTGMISLLKKDTEEQIPCHVPGKPAVTAGWIRDQAKEVAKGSRSRTTQFWREDGVNVVKVLTDMQKKQGDYPQGYRNFLYMTNYSRTQQGQELVVTKVLSLDEEKQVKGLICMEYTHKHIRLSWTVAKNADGTQSVDADCLFTAAKSLNHEYPHDPIACSFSDSAQMAEAKEGEIQTLTFTVPNINWGYSVLRKYMNAMKERDAAFFLMVMVVAGEIGGRGVRYKTAKTHELVLTDMFYAFAVSPNHQISAHGTGAMQALGRLCTMARDISDCPTIKLWTPEDCWTLIKLWMEAFDRLTDLLDYKRQHGLLTMEEALARATRDRSIPFPHFQQLLTAPTGHNSKGEPLYARPSHLHTPSKQLIRKLAEHPKCVPVEPLRFEGGREKRKAAMAELMAAEHAMKDNGESIAATEGPLPPVGPGEVSIAEPKDRPRRTVHRGKHKGEHQLASLEERMAIVNAIPDFKKVYEIMKHYTVEVGTGYATDVEGLNVAGIDIVDIKDIENFGGTVEDVSNQLAKNRISLSIDISIVLKDLVYRGLVQVSSNFPQCRRLKEVRYWIPVDKGRTLDVYGDPLEYSQGSASKRGRPSGSKNKH